jgi:hypothetical protein
MAHCGRLASIGLALLAAWTIAAGAFASPAAAGPPPANTGRSLRILTFNTAFLWADLPGACGSIDINGKEFGGVDYDTRAKSIAHAILKTDNDVVVLNEVFSDNVKETLVDELSAAYPTFISKIAKPLEAEVPNALLTLIAPGSIPCQDPGPTTTITAADSGLMIFVKNGLELVPFSTGTSPPYEVAEVEGRQNGSFWGAPGQIAVDTYHTGHVSPIPGLGGGSGECSREDCFASKAIAMVRVRNPGNGDVFNIGFTHTQAQEAFEQVAVRERQLEDIKNLITASLKPIERSSEPVYVAGDLNIRGQNKDHSKPSSEWTKFFNSSGSSSKQFFACGLGPCGFSPATPNGSLLTDSWGFETSTDDEGVTNADDDARLDYFLHNQHLPGLSTRLCLQHVMRAYDLEDDFSPLSDHIGVRADVNAASPHCSANDDAGSFGPQKVTFAFKPFFSRTGTIRNRGGMKWFKLGKGVGWGTGSYVFKVTPVGTGFGVGFDVYESKDLSKPIPMFKEEPGNRGVKYSLPEPPYYIRVFLTDPSTGLPDRTRTGKFKILIRENRGLEPSDAIALRPGIDKFTYPWPALSPLTKEGTHDNVIFKPDTQVWYEFFTSKSTGGKFPEVFFLSENTLGIAPDLPKAPFAMKLRSATATYPVLAEELDQAEGDNGVTSFHHDYDRDGKPDYRLKAPHLGKSSDPKLYFLTLKRNEPAMYDTLRSITTFYTTLTFIKSMRLKIWKEVPTAFVADQVTFQWAYDSDGTPLCLDVGPLVCYGPVELEDDDQWTPPDASFNGSFARSLRPRIWDHGVELNPRNSAIITALSPSSSDVASTNFIWGAGASNADDADYWYELRYCVHHEEAWAARCKLTD